MRKQNKIIKNRKNHKTIIKKYKKQKKYLTQIIKKHIHFSPFFKSYPKNHKYSSKKSEKKIINKLIL